MMPDVNLERVRYDLDFRPPGLRLAHYGHYVEPAVSFGGRIAFQEPPCRSGEFSPLSGVDRELRRGKRVRTARFNLDEHDSTVMIRNDIYLTAASPEVRCEHPISCAFERSDGDSFSGLPNFSCFWRRFFPAGRSHWALYHLLSQVPFTSPQVRLVVSPAKRPNVARLIPRPCSI